MITNDILVYAHPDGATYVAIIGEDDGWWRWPAEANGWASRVRCPASLAEECEELPPRRAHFALLASGVTASAVDASDDIHQRG